MNILLTARGPRLTDIIGQLARDLGNEADVRALAFYGATHKRLRDQGIKTYDPAVLGDVGLRQCRDALAGHTTGEGTGFRYKGIPLLDRTHFERRRAEIEGRSATPEHFVRRALRTAGAMDTILAEFEPDLVTVWNGCILEARICSELGQRAGAEVRYCERGLLPNSLVIDPKGVNAQSVLCTDAWDEIAAADVRESDAKRIRAFVRELTRSGKSVVDQPDRCAPDALRRRLGLPDHSRLVLLPAQIDWDTNIVYNSPHFDTNAEVLSALMPVVEDTEDVYVIFKPHPEEPASFDFEGLLGDRGRMVTRVNLHSLIDAADAVVVRNSTVGLEAALHQKPVVVLGRALYSHKGFTYDLPERDGLDTVLARALREQFSDEMTRRLEQFLIHLTRNYLYFLNGHEVFPGSNTRLVARLIESARQAQTEYPVATPFRPALRHSLEQVETQCARARAALHAVREMKARNPQQALLIQACDHHRFLRALRHVARSGIADRYTVLARSPRDRAAIRSVDGVAGLGSSIAAGIRETLKARFGAHDVVIFVTNDSEKVSAKVRWTRRLLAGVPCLIVERGLADALNLPPGRPDRDGDDEEGPNTDKAHAGGD